MLRVECVKVSFNENAPSPPPSGINQYIVGFFIGIIVGYLVSHQLIYQRFNLSKRTEVILWTVSFVALSSVMFWFNTLHRINQPIPRLSILLWFSVGKLIACIAIGWMLYALCVGRAGTLAGRVAFGFLGSEIRTKYFTAK